MTRMLSAVVLAGGRSSRMGSDKALLPHPEGVPLLQRQLELVRALAPDDRWVSARAGQSLPPLDPDVRRVDDDGTAGPLGGIAAALRVCRHPRLLVVGVDLPRLDPETLRRLDDLSGGRGVVARLDGRLEPLAAVYPRAWLPVAEAALSRGEFSLQRLLGGAGAREWFETVPAPSAAPFLNWNRPGDFVR